MIKVEVTVENFVNGRTRVAKGEVIEVAPPIARYIVRNNEGKIVGKTPAPKKPPAKKKATYKTRDMKADNETVGD